MGEIGVGMNSAERLARIVTEADVDTVMLAGRYTLLEQGALDDVLPACVARGVAVAAAGVFNSGVLARAVPDEASTYDYQRTPPEVLRRVRLLAQVCAEHGVTLPQAALHFPSGHPAVRTVVVGARSSRRGARERPPGRCAGASEPVEDLRARGLLDPRAPLPEGRPAS